MKLEKISDNQIRCTLTKEDLESRHIRISELAYGSDKARALFQDMMKQARARFGFNADNIPLMIEAIPGKDGIMLLISKVQDPEELDARFARFAPQQNGKKNIPDLHIDDADDIVNMIRQLYEAKKKAATPSEDGSASPVTQETAPEGAKPEPSPAPSEKPDRKLDFERILRFATLDLVIDAARSLGEAYNGNNSLYKDTDDLPYCLILHKSAHTPEEFNRVCNILAEFGSSRECTPAKEAHLREHAKVIIGTRALQKLRQL